jgi:Tfp pilus assembly protein PilO
VRFDIRLAGRVFVVLYAVMAVINVAFFLLLTRPTVHEYTNMTQKTAPLMRAVQRREDQVADIEEYASRLEQAENDLVRLREEILATKNTRMVDVQIELHRIAEKFGINTEQVSYQNEILAEEDLERFAMVVPLEGGYQALRGFIQAVESSEQFMVVERVQLGRSSEGGVMLELNVTLATYFDAPLLAEPRGRRRT